MASTSYLARVIIKPHEEGSGFEGSYNLLMAAKSISAPMSAPNPIESTTTEDAVQTYEMGIKSSDMKEVNGNLDKSDFQRIGAMEGTKVDVIQLYGTDGVGGVGKFAYVGQVAYSPDDVGGVDEILGMTAYIVPNTAAVECTDDLNVVDNKDGTFTVTKVA